MNADTENTQISRKSADAQNSSESKSEQSNNWRILILRLLLGSIMSAASGMLVVLAYPPFELWPLVFIGWIPMVFAAYRVMPERWSSLAAGIGIFTWLQGYLGPVFAGSGLFMEYLPLIAGAISFLTDMGLKRMANQTNNQLLVLQGVLGMAVSELIRLFIPIAGTWAFIAYPLYRQVWLIQPVTIFGIIGMGAIVMLVNYTLALLLMKASDRRWAGTWWYAPDSVSVPASAVRRYGRICLWSVGGWILISLILFGLFAFTYDQPTVKTAAIQPAKSPIQASMKGDDEAAEELHLRMIQMSREAADAGAEFIVWPEGAFLFDPQEQDPYNLPALSRETDAYHAIGYAVVLDDGRMRNEATVLSPEGAYIGVFGKDHPVTFAGETSVTKGSYPVYETPLGRLGTIICYDLDYTDTTRKLARRGVQLVGVPSNDWSAIADKHYTHLVFRAAENRVAMVKADGAGFDSAIISPSGRIIEKVSDPQGREALVSADVQIGTGRGTLYSYIGDWVGWLSLLTTIGLGIFKKRIVRRFESTAGNKTPLL